MTRLVSEDIIDISAELQAYDRVLLQRTGLNLLGIACHAIQVDRIQLCEFSKDRRFAVVPIGSGQGVIPRFSETVRDIIRHIGCRAELIEKSDVAGIAEAGEKQFDFIMMADDLRFISLGMKNSHVVDNSAATAKGFVAALDLMSGGIEAKEVLIIGCGQVGYFSAIKALQMGADICIYDRDHERSRKLAFDLAFLFRLELKKPNVRILDLPENDPFCNFDLLIEATNSADVVRAYDIHSRTCITAPGMPLGLDADAIDKIGNRLIHDPLQLGVAVMAVESLNSLMARD